MPLPRGIRMRDRLSRSAINVSCRWPGLHFSPPFVTRQRSLPLQFYAVAFSSAGCKDKVASDTLSLRLTRRFTQGQLALAMTSLTQHRHHAGHSHSHHHDNTYLTSTNKKDAGVRITRIGLYVNFLMALGKGVGGYLLNSQSLIADAFHSLTDLVSDFLTLATVAWSLKPPTARFPSGYGKIESLGALGVSSLLLAGGLGLGWHSGEILYSHLFLDAAAAATEHHHHGHEHAHGAAGIFGHSHSHNPADMGIPSIHAAWIAGGSIIIKEYLYRASESIPCITVAAAKYCVVTAIKIARERKSSVLASNAIHHRIDSLTSIVALTAILGSNILNNVSWLDPVGGLLVSIMVVQAGWRNTGRALLELADVGIDSEIRDSVVSAASEALTNESFASGKVHGRDIEVREVQGIKAGQSYLLDVELAVPENMTIQETRPVEDLVRQKVGSQVRGTRRVKVKFVARNDESTELADEFVSADLNSSSNPEHNHSDHSHDHHDEHHGHHANGLTAESEPRKRR